MKLAPDSIVEDTLNRQPRLIDRARLPRHVALIMDGNGRWAARQQLPRIEGHRAGADAVRRTVEAAARLGIGYLTLFAFSTENWKRPRFEVDGLMELLKEFIASELTNLLDNNICFRMIGRRDGLEPGVLSAVQAAERATAACTGLVLTIAINYGGRAEIVDACRRIAYEVTTGSLQWGRIDEDLIASKLYDASAPDPDLLIRTSGEMRISNFLIWQIAYSELYVTLTLWPDFGEHDFLAAVAAYQERDRRYGGQPQRSLSPSKLAL